MNDDRSLERHITSAYEDLAPPREPEGLLDDVLLSTSRTRQRPHWLSLIKEPPMRTSNTIAVGSPTARVAAIVVATLLLAVALAAAGIAGQRLLGADSTIVVDPTGNGDYTTINEAVAAAQDGDTVLVKPGTYAESIVIDKSISLLGEDRGSVIIEFSVGCTWDEESEEQTCPPDTPLVHTESPSGMFASDDPFGIQLVQTDAVVGSLTVHDHLSGFGIIAFGGAPVIHDVTLTRPDEGGRIFVEQGSAATVRGSELGAFAAEYESPVTLTDNTILEINVNLENTDSVGGESLVQGNRIGWMSIGGPVTVEDNEFPESMASAEDGPIGIYVERGGGWVIRDNVIRGRQNGIKALTDGLLEDNVLERNGVGLYHVGDPPAMVGNRICDNTVRNVMSERSTAEIDRTANEICDDT